MRVKTWRILDRGEVPEGAARVPFNCQCGYEAYLPVRGRPLAILSRGIVFDTGEPSGALPATIQCRKCGRILEH